MKARLFILSMFWVVAHLSGIQIAAAQESQSNAFHPSTGVDIIDGSTNDTGYDSDLVTNPSRVVKGDSLPAPVSDPYDVNRDGSVDITDVTDLIEYLLNGNVTDDRVVRMRMQAGDLKNGLSREYGNRNTGVADNNYWNYCHTTLLLDISGCTITNVALQDDETL